MGDRDAASRLGRRHTRRRLTRRAIPQGVPLEISALSLQYVKVPIAATKNGAKADPTADAVKMAFPSIDAEPDTWITGSWESTGTKHFARCLVGPAGAIELERGYYDVYVQIQDDPETPVVKATDTLQVY